MPPPLVLLSQPQGNTFALSHSETVQVKTEDLACPRDLVCIDDNCQGTAEYGPFFDFLGQKQSVQTGICTVVSICGPESSPKVLTMYFRARLRDVVARKFLFLTTIE